MKKIYNINNLYLSQYKNHHGDWKVSRPESGHGLLYLEIRIRMAWACLTGKADAVTFD